MRKEITGKVVLITGASAGIGAATALSLDGEGARVGRIDVLINNAASMIVVPAEQVSQEDLLQAIHTNLLGPVAATQEAVIQMRKQGGG